MFRRRLAFVLALALTACGGGGGGASGGGGGGVITPPVVSKTLAFLTLNIPSVGPSAVKRPAFIDPATNAISVTVNGTTVTGSDLVAQCNPSGTVCTVSIVSPPGTDTFDITLGSSAYPLEHGTVTAQLAAGQTTAIHLTFHGIPTSAAIVADNEAPRAGAPTSFHLTLRAFDRAGNEIIGDDYDKPIAITQNDPNGHLQLVSNVFTKPGDTVTVNYDGHLMTTQASYAATGGVTTQASSYVLGNPYATYPTAGDVVAIAPGANGAIWFADCYLDTTCAPAIATASGTVTEFGRLGTLGAVTLGPDGNAWFAGGWKNPNVYRVTPSGTVTTFAVRSISPIEAYEVHAIIAGPDGNMWFAEGDRIDKMTMAGAVTHYPLATYYRPTSLVLGPDGRLWFDDDPEVAAIDMAGAISHYTLSQGRYTTSSVAWGSDGLLHLNAYLGGGPGGCYCTMTTAGIEGSIALAPGTGPSSRMAAGPGGNIWYLAMTQVMTPSGISQQVPAFAYVDASGRQTAYPYLGTSFSGTAIVVSTDGTLWSTFGTGLAKFINDP